MNGLHAELSIQCDQREYKSDGRAVGIGHDKAAAADALFLKRQRIEVIRIDLRNEQRDVGFHAMR